MRAEEHKSDSHSSQPKPQTCRSNKPSHLLINIFKFRAIPNDNHCCPSESQYTYTLYSLADSAKTTRDRDRRNCTCSVHIETLDQSKIIRRFITDSTIGISYFHPVYVQPVSVRLVLIISSNSSILLACIQHLWYIYYSYTFLYTETSAIYICIYIYIYIYIYPKFLKRVFVT